MCNVKKILAIILVAAMIMGIPLPVYATTAREIAAEDVVANIGDTVDVRIVIKNNPGIAVLSIKVKYSEELTLISVTDGDILGEDMHGKKLEDNPYNLTWNNMNDFSEDGTLVTLTFRVSENCEAGTVLSVELISDEDIYNINEEFFEFDVVDGSVTVVCNHESKTEVPAKSADCENTGNNLYYVCDSCGVVYMADGETETTVEAETIPALGHDYADATCTEAATCARCGKSTGAALGHSFTNYVSNNDATCTEDGTKTAKCDRCEVTDTVTDVGSAKGHDYADASCTDPKTCKICGATNGEPNGHSYAAEWSKDKDGHWHACTACGDVIDSAEHDFGDSGDKCVVCEYERDHVHRLTLVPAVDAGCVNAGNHAYYTCSGCEDWFEDASGSVVIADKNSVVIDALGHALSDATCTEAATCARCGHVEGEALGHSFTNYESDGNATCTEDGTKTAKCDRCTMIDTVMDEGSALGHDYADATCNNPKTCKVCGATEGEALGHSFTSYNSNNDATCTEDGTKTAKCDRCEVTDTVTDEGSAKGHDYADASCTAPKTCKACGVTEGEALGHSYAAEWSKGEDGHWHECTTCGDKIDSAEHDFGTEGDKCVVCEYERTHVHRLTLVPAVDATCTEAGSKAYYTCSGCENWFEDASGSVLIADKTSVVIGALGHDMSEATCTEAATCARCGHVDGTALGHTFSNYESDGNATCTEDGTKTAKCDRCDVTDTVIDEGSALGHDYAEATCTAPKTCKICGITEGEALGHSFEDGVCTDCGVKDPDYEDEEDEPCKPGWKSWLRKWLENWWGNEEDSCDHVYTSVVTDPTCTKKGYTTHTCEHCGDCYVDSYVDATGHNYVDGICTECGHEECKKPSWPIWFNWFWKK